MGCIEALQQIGDVPALEHDGASGDLGGVGSKDGRDADVGEKGEGLREGGSGELQRAQGTAQGAALDFGSSAGAGFGFEFVGEPAAFAMVGFGEVDELEVEGKGAGELVGAGG